MTNWPWPLGGVQDFFEGLAETIVKAAAPLIQGVIDTLRPAVEGVSSAVWNALPSWIREGLLFIAELAGRAWGMLWDFIRDPVGSIQAGLNWVVNSITTGIGSVRDALGLVAGKVWELLPDWLQGPILWLKDLAAQAWAGLWNFVRDPVGSIQAGLTWVATTISTAFDGALSTFGGWVTDALGAVSGALGVALQGFLQWLGEKLSWLAGVILGAVEAVKTAAAGFFTDMMRGFVTAMTSIFSPGSPGETDTAIAETMVATMVKRVERMVQVPHTSSISYEALIPAVVTTVGRFFVLKTAVEAIGAAVDAAHPAKELKAHAIAAGLMGMLDMPAVIGPLLGSPVKHGLLTPWDQVMLERYRPTIPGVADAQRMLWRGSITMSQFLDVVGRSGYGAPFDSGYATLTAEIPGPGDLIRFVVREVIDVATFNVNMAYQGFSAFWSSAFWEAHWILPAPGNLVEAMHRGIIDRAELNTFYVLHDYKPEPRPGIGISDRDIMSRLTKTLIPRVDLRRGFRIGRLSREDLDARYGMLGYEEDSRLMTDIQVGLAFETEVNKLRDNAKDDLVNGFIVEATLRADLAEIGLGPDLIDYHVADALADRERNRKKKLLSIYEDAYLKDLKTYEELETDASKVIVDPDALDVYLTTAWVSKYKKPKAGAAA